MSFNNRKRRVSKVDKMFAPESDSFKPQKIRLNRNNQQMTIAINRKVLPKGMERDFEVTEIKLKKRRKNGK